MATINGTSGNDILNGTPDDDLINGFEGDDTLNGQGGNDILDGGPGNDRYFIVSGSEQIVESGTGELDIVFSDVDYRLGSGARIETLRPVDERGTAPLVFWGNEFAQIIVGNDGDNSLFGNGGSDTLVGGGGNDTYIVSEAGVLVAESPGQGYDTILTTVTYSLRPEEEIEVLSTRDVLGTAALNLTGNEYGQYLFGNAGQNSLDGGGGSDAMYGYGGDDWYYVDSLSDVVIETAGEGYDRVLASGSHLLAAGSEIEVLRAIDPAATTAIHLTGNEYGQFLFGNAGQNSLDGGGGADAMYGFGGDDWYYVDSLNDVVIEAAGEGYDRVLASESHALAAGSEIEVLRAIDPAATTALNLTGNEYGQYLFGNAGQNSLDGGGGSDAMYGYGGDDWYYVDSLSDVVIETAGEGYDRVLASGSHLLAAGSEIEVLRAIDPAATTAIHLTGNEYGQFLFGNAGQNSLDGGGGADAMYGFGGDDWYYVDSLNDVVIEAAGEGYDRVLASESHALAAGSEIEVLRAIDPAATTALNLTGNEYGQYLFGNAGNNRIDGGAGSDALYGYGGNDQFAFTTALGAGNVDIIGDFVSGVDRILLDDAVFTGLAPGVLDPAAFRIGTAAQDGDDRIIYNSGTGALSYDRDGIGGVDAVLFAYLEAGLPLTATDFVVINFSSGEGAWDY